MSPQIEWLTAAENGESEEWDEIVDAAGLVGTWRRSVLSAYARAGLRETHLAIARDGGVPIALFCLVAGLSSLPSRRYAGPSRRFSVRPLLCRLPLSFSPGYHFLPDLSADESVQVLRLLVAAVAARFGPAVPAVGFLAVPESDAALFGWSAVSVELSPVAVVDVPPGGADEFLRAQPRRRRVRLLDAAARASGVVVEQHHRSPDTLVELDVATRLRHAPNQRIPTPLPATFLDALMESKSARLFGFEQPFEQLAAFDVLLPARTEWLALNTGCRDDVENRDLIAAALFLRELDAVAESGATRLMLGAGSLPAKVQMGARLSTLRLHVTPSFQLLPSLQARLRRRPRLL